METPDRKDHTMARTNPLGQRIWDSVSALPLSCLWDLQGAPISTLAKRIFKSFLEDNLLSRAAELGFFFLFALFPTLVCASSILGLAARSAAHIYVALLDYMALVIPRSAFNIVLETFNQTAAASSSGKLTFGLFAAIWSASVGFSAIQDTLNTVYKVRETRPYWKARGSAILVTLLLAVLVTLILATLFGGDFLARRARLHIFHPLRIASILSIHGITGIITAVLLIFFFDLIYYFAPDVQNSKWHWLTPGAAIGLFGWFASSQVLRVYMHYFDNYSVTYGSLGAVIILLTWFYLTGLMLLLGAEINSEIEAAAAEKRLKAAGVIPTNASTDPQHPIQP